MIFPTLTAARPILLELCPTCPVLQPWVRITVLNLAKLATLIAQSLLSMTDPPWAWCPPRHRVGIKDVLVAGLDILNRYLSIDRHIVIVNGGQHELAGSYAYVNRDCRVPLIPVSSPFRY